MNEIHIVPNFLSDRECKFYVDYIDSNIDSFTVTKMTKRCLLCFGYNSSKSEQRNNGLERIETIKEEVVDLFARVENTIKEFTKSEKDLFVCSFCMAKQENGSRILIHSDVDNDSLSHFKYSGVVYLNTMKDRSGGTLNFPNMQYSYSPVAGDLVIFPSNGRKYLHEVSSILEDRYSIPFWVTEDPAWSIN